MRDYLDSGRAHMTSKIKTIEMVKDHLLANNKMDYQNPQYLELCNGVLKEIITTV
jgi:hypothetical protein